MIFKYELRFVALTWPNLLLVSGICKLKPKNLKKPKNEKNLKTLGKKEPSFLPVLGQAYLHSCVYTQSTDTISTHILSNA